MNRKSHLLFFSVVVLALRVSAAHAQETRDEQKPAETADPAPPLNWYDVIAIHGFVDGYYAWNDNAPRSHENFVPGTGTTAERANEFDLNLAEVDFVRDPKPVGFHLSLVAGNGTDVVHAGEPQGTGVGRDVYRSIYQASLSCNVAVGRGLLIEGGIYPSHIGFEGFYSKDNWNYTRGWLGEFSPYYQTGVKASYAWSDRWSGQLHILNGWQIIGENNDAKSVGTQLAYSSDKFSASLNTFLGPELANDNKHLRSFGDLVTTWKSTPKISIGASLDRGRQALPDDNAANWLGVGAWARYTIDSRHATALRVERFRDPDNGISGASQKLTGVTLTYEVRPVENLILKVEARRDHSTAPVFGKGSGGMSADESLFVFGAVATF
jgi:hypothetical protein